MSNNKRKTLKRNIRRPNKYANTVCELDKKKKNVEDKIDTDLGDVEDRVASDCSGERSKNVVKDNVEKEVLNIEDEEISLNKSASDVLRSTITF